MGYNPEELELIGQGAESRVYDVSLKIGRPAVLKLYRLPSDQLYAGDPAERSAVERRRKLNNEKLPSFPKGLPREVISPEELVIENGVVRGYTMPLIRDAEPLSSFRVPRFRATVDDARVLRIFRNLHRILSAIHRHRNGVLIGDFFDGNVLVKGTNPYLVDADSFQFRGYPCMLYHEMFVDPLIMDFSQDPPEKVGEFSKATDWYAFCVALFQSLLGCQLYGGSHSLSVRERHAQRVTIFDSGVVRHKNAPSLNNLPQTYLDLFYEVFVEDKRIKFPKELLDIRRWEKG